MPPRSKDDPPTRRAKLFWNGRSQAVRLPKEFRFEGDEVQIHREGDAVVLEATPKRSWPQGYWTWVAGATDDLELGEITPLGGGLLDVSLDDDG